MPEAVDKIALTSHVISDSAGGSEPDSNAQHSLGSHPGWTMGKRKGNAA